jgi:hypothetical protein
MTSQANQANFEGTAVVPGAEVVLSDGTSARLDKAELELPLFLDNDGATASAGQLLAAFYRQTNSTPQDHIPRETLADALAVGTATGNARLEVRNGGEIQFKDGGTMARFDRILFDIEFTVRATPIE